MNLFRFKNMSLRVGLIQLAVGSCKKTNLSAAAGLIQKAKQQGMFQFTFSPIKP